MGNIMDNVMDNIIQKIKYNINTIDRTDTVDRESNKSDDSDESDKSDPELYRCYFLLYKLKKSPIFWVARVSQTLDDLTIIIEEFQSKIENYYIVKRNVKNIENQLDFKQFTKFKTNKFDLIITQTD